MSNNSPSNGFIFAVQEDEHFKGFLVALNYENAVSKLTNLKATHKEYSNYEVKYLGRDYNKKTKTARTKFMKRHNLIQTVNINDK